MLEAEIYVALKKTVADPQGLTIKHALESLGYENLQEIRYGKYITVKIDSADRKEAEKNLNEMCGKLLANPIIEDYRVTIKEI